MIKYADPELRALYLRLYCDEDVSLDIVDNLRQRDFDVLSARAVGNLRQNDDAQLAFAVSQQRTFLTHNRHDFELRHQAYLMGGQTHYGIIIAKRRPTDEAVVAKLLALFNQVTADEMINQLRYV
jgi:hypothetical protein